MNKISIKFYNDKPVRAIWNEESNQWYFSVLDVVGAIRNESDYSKNRNYWKYLKTKLKKENSQLVSVTNQLKLEASDGKKYKSDTLNSEGIILLAKEFPSNHGSKFLDWFTNSDNTLDNKSKQKAYDLFESELIDSFEIGTTKGLQQIHAFIFSGLFDFAGQIRTKTISKEGFLFANGDFLPSVLETIDKMPESNEDEIFNKYIEMNIAHPFMEGNGRSTRIWLDLILKKELNKCVDWSLIDKNEYLDAMRESPLYPDAIKKLLTNALTDKINDREIFMKGIDYSYYYEEE